jgi:hypothetical protein
MRTPIRKFAEQESVTTRYLYSECKAGRLTLTKVGRRTFIDDIDAEAWRALAPKVTGTAGNTAMLAAKQKLEHLGKIVAAGQLDRRHVVEHLTAIIQKAGLTFEATA